MGRNTKITLGLLVLLAAIVGLIGLWASKRLANQTATAIGTVVAVETDERRGKDDTIVTLSYQAGTATAQGRARVKGVHLESYPAGRQVQICYDPANPKSLRIDDGPCG